MNRGIQKSKKNIQNTFINLRRKYPVHKIRVNELCELADVNKSTFYRYYTSVYALNDEMENETINRFADDITAAQDIRKNCREFFMTFDNVINGKNNIRIKEILFRDDYSRMLMKLEQAIKYRLLDENDSNFEEYIRLSYVIGGAFSVCMTLYNNGGVEDTMPVYELLAKLSENTLRGS